MQAIQDIARDLKIPRTETQELLDSALTKCWQKIKVLFPNENSFERMNFLGRMLGIETEEDWPEFFYGFPENIRLEVLEAIKSNESGFKNLDCSKFLQRA